MLRFVRAWWPSHVGRQGCFSQRWRILVLESTHCGVDHERCDGKCAYGQMLGRSKQHVHDARVKRGVQSVNRVQTRERTVRQGSLKMIKSYIRPSIGQELFAKKVPGMCMTPTVRPLSKSATSVFLKS